VLAFAVERVHELKKKSAGHLKILVAVRVTGIKVAKSLLRSRNYQTPRYNIWLACRPGCVFIGGGGKGGAHYVFCDAGSEFT